MVNSSRSARTSSIEPCSLLRYTDRPFHEISLGGLLIAVVLRTIQFNMTRMRDKYLHTNCLAALANMSSQFQNLHNYVAQKIVSLFHLLARKHARTLDLLHQQSKQDAASSSPDLSTDGLTNEYVQDLTIIEDVMRMVLEIINSCLTHTLRHNINLIYTLLYNRDVFENFRTHPSFQDILQNIDTVGLLPSTARIDRCIGVRSGDHVLRWEGRQTRATFDGIRERNIGIGRETVSTGSIEGKRRVSREQSDDLPLPSARNSRNWNSNTWKKSNQKISSFRTSGR